ncbi:MAG: DUF5689 domain-containing protein [Rikenellaceae bacterium]|jgi:hypothetical protein|nr:DUF5689 domain-containing protein [Rikenellaceae bacterium]
MKRLIIIGIGLLLLGGCTRTYFTPPDLTPHLQEPTMTLREMQALWRGETLTFTDAYLIGGVVTASDASGNFYRTFFLDDTTGGVEVMAGLYDLHTLYPVGRVVYINLKGLTLTLNEETGVFQLGIAKQTSNGTLSVDYIGHSALIDRHVTRAGMNYEFRIPELSIGDLTDARLGQLITIQGVRFGLGGEETWATLGGGATKELLATDDTGHRIYITTSDYADFAGETTPTGTLDITGILTKQGKNYALKMRDLRDVFTIGSF